MKETKGRVLTGRWIHPAEGENYPVELVMEVQELREGLSDSLSWQTSTDYSGQGFRVSEWQYVHLARSSSIFFSVKADDGRWVHNGSMAPEKWSVPRGSHDAAREVMRAYFTEAGYTQVPQ